MTRNWNQIVFNSDVFEITVQTLEFITIALTVTDSSSFDSVTASGRRSDTAYAQQT